MHWVFMANGVFSPSERIIETLRQAGRIVAVDGGVQHLHDLGVAPDLLLGDMDSAPGNLQHFPENQNTTVKIYPCRKDATDLELALRMASAEGASEMTILGASGGRLDHLLGNIFLGAQLAQKTDTPFCILTDSQALYYTADALEISGRVGELVSILPLTEKVHGVSLQGLEYPLENAELPFGSSRGLSNVFQTPTARISLTKGLLAVVHTFETA